LIFLSLHQMLLFLMISQRPVIELDKLYIEGQVHRPPVIELEKSHLEEKIEKTALYNVIQLEKRLLKPATLDDFKKSAKSAK